MGNNIQTGRTRKELRSALSHVFYVFNQIGAHHSWNALCSTHPQIIDASPLFMMLQNAAIESSLVSLRALNEFFKPNGRQDDLRASQFPMYATQGAFLSTNDELEINKRLAHLTWHRESDHSGFAIKAHMMNAIERMLHFIDYLLNSFLRFGEPEFDEAISLRQILPDYLHRIV